MRKLKLREENHLLKVTQLFSVTVSHAFVTKRPGLKPDPTVIILASLAYGTANGELLIYSSSPANETQSRIGKSFPLTTLRFAFWEGKLNWMAAEYRASESFLKTKKKKKKKSGRKEQLQTGEDLLIRFH